MPAENPIADHESNLGAHPADQDDGRPSATQRLIIKIATAEDIVVRTNEALVNAMVSRNAEMLGIDVAKAKPRLKLDIVLASSKIEREMPTSEYLEDCIAVIEGTLSSEVAAARSLARALAKNHVTGFPETGFL